tara:strand:+ start:46 stop:471 length:426 start_codon:yes stop_codon:yes gene_type:complete
VKKKDIVSSKDKEDWISFVKEMKNISSKEEDLTTKIQITTKIPKIDLHGFSLEEANSVVKKFINKSFEKGFKKILIITGKGSRSKSHENPYISEKLSTLQSSVPEYINNDQTISAKVRKITQASKKDGGEGAIYIFLKKTL